MVMVTIEKGDLSLSVGKRKILTTNLKGRLTNLRIAPDLVSFLAPAGIGKGAMVTLFGRDRKQLLLARQDGKDIAVTDTDGGLTLHIAPTATQEQSVLVVFQPAAAAN